MPLLYQDLQCQRQATVLVSMTIFLLGKASTFKVHVGNSSDQIAIYRNGVTNGATGGTARRTTYTARTKVRTTSTFDPRSSRYR